MPSSILLPITEKTLKKYTGKYQKFMAILFLILWKKIGLNGEVEVEGRKIGGEVMRGCIKKYIACFSTL